MSVHPGFGGQKFIPESLDKIREVRAMLNEKNLETDIQETEESMWRMSEKYWMQAQM